MPNIIRHEPRNELTVLECGELNQELVRLTEPLPVESELLKRINWVRRFWIEDWRDRQTYGDEHGYGPPKVVPTLDTERLLPRFPARQPWAWGPEVDKIEACQQVLNLLDEYMTTPNYHT